MDRWGRKAGVLYCAVFSLVGGSLLCGARNISMFIVARFIAGWGSWGFLAVSTCNGVRCLDRRSVDMEQPLHTLLSLRPRASAGSSSA
jgi:predicted MFS family arabinose efflux permease